MARFAKLLVALALVGGLGTVGASTASAGDFCHDHDYIGYNYDFHYAPAYVAPVCVYKVFYYDHCGHYRCYGTYHSLFAAKVCVHRLDHLGYHAIVKTIH